jgi:ABC-2 type transport system ATP-binding protein
MSNTVLSCNNINKYFKKKQILNNVSFDLKEGEILGFIGPNGAGKTTTIKLILGLQSISSGTVKINGYDIEKDFVKAIERVGAIVENPDFYMYLSGYKNLQLVANMYKNVDKNRIDEVVKLVGLEKRINDKVSKYSLGMRQRLGIAQAIINKPNLLVLDEPTNGLDPEGIKELRDLMVKLAEKEKMAIFISSHNLAELESFCNTVCIIKNGKVIENSSMKDLKTDVTKELSEYVVEIENTKLLNDSIITEFKEKVEIVSDSVFKIKIKREEVPSFVKKLVENNINIYEIYEEEVTLEEAFLKRTGGNVIG